MRSLPGFLITILTEKSKYARNDFTCGLLVYDLNQSQRRHSKTDQKTARSNERIQATPHCYSAHKPHWDKKTPYPLWWYPVQKACSRDLQRQEHTQLSHTFSQAKKQLSSVHRNMVNRAKTSLIEYIHGRDLKNDSPLNKIHQPRDTEDLEQDSNLRPRAYTIVNQCSGDM